MDIMTKIVSYQIRQKTFNFKSTLWASINYNFFLNYSTLSNKSTGWNNAHLFDFRHRMDQSDFFSYEYIQKIDNYITYFSLQMFYL